MLDGWLVRMWMPDPLGNIKLNIQFLMILVDFHFYLAEIILQIFRQIRFRPHRRGVRVLVRRALLKDTTEDWYEWKRMCKHSECTIRCFSIVYGPRHIGDHLRDLLN